MVSVNEKYFIEQLACENAVKGLNTQKFINSKPSCSDNNSKQLRSNASEGYKCDNRDVSWEDHDNYEENRINGKLEHSIRNCDVSHSPRKRIASHHQVIDNINNILSSSYLISSPSTSGSRLKRFSSNGTDEKLKNFKKAGDDSSWHSPSSSLTRKRSWPISQSNQTFQVHRKRFYSKYDESDYSKRSQIKNYTIPPLDANWKYENGEYDDIVNKVKERTSQSKDWVRIHVPKVSLLGDSHARHLADIFTEMLPGFKIESSVKPGAKSKRVLSSFKNVLQLMGKNDFVVTLSGTNDMWDETLEEPKTVVYNAVMEARRTNLLLCNVPNNYLEPNDSPVQDNILNFNQFYQDVVNFSKWTQLVDVYGLKDRKLFTRHGLHFNLYGKIKICDLVSNKILDIIDLVKKRK